MTPELLKRFEDALQIVHTGKDNTGSCYNSIGRLNQAAWIGEHSGHLIEEVKRLQAQVEDLEHDLEELREENL